jgi:hypothetical protein
MHSYAAARSQRRNRAGLFSKITVQPPTSGTAIVAGHDIIRDPNAVRSNIDESWGDWLGQYLIKRRLAKVRTIWKKRQSANGDGPSKRRRRSTKDPSGEI